MSSISPPAGPQPITVFVCTTCRTKEEDGVQELGASLYERIAGAIDEGRLGEAVQLEPVECLSVCKRPATIGVSGADRWTYIYGDIDPDTHLDAVVEGLLKYAASADGIVPWRERPTLFKRGVVARIPPRPEPAPIKTTEEKSHP